MGSMIKVGALWAKEKSNGEEYLVGKFGEATLMVYKNGFKKTDSHPDFLVYVTEGPHQRKKDGGGGGKGGYKPQKQPQLQESEEDVPF